ncbi:MAG: ATP-binding protein [Halanaerobiales bacterium]
MVQRMIVEINEEKCNGCGLCIPACHEGAIEIVDGKARLVDDKFCDGIGDCLGECPEGAIRVIEREAGEYDEEAVQQRMAEMSKQGNSKSKLSNITARENHNSGGCPGTRMMDLRDIENTIKGSGESVSGSKEKEANATAVNSDDVQIKIKSQLEQWPVQLMLVPENAPYFDGAELLLTADCVPVAYPDYHLDLLQGKAVAMGCPKLDDNNYYTEKLTSIINNNDIKGITVAFMEVPCCSGLIRAAEQAISNSSKDILLTRTKISISGEKELV